MQLHRLLDVYKEAAEASAVLHLRRASPPFFSAIRDSYRSHSFSFKLAANRETAGMWRSEKASDMGSSRGGPTWRGRGRGGFPTRGGWPPASSGRNIWGWASRAKPVIAPSPEPALGPLLISLTKSDFDEDAKKHESQSVITGCKAVASYNWLDRSEPTIVVPGMSMAVLVPRLRPTWAPPLTKTNR